MLSHWHACEWSTCVEKLIVVVCCDKYVHLSVTRDTTGNCSYLVCCYRWLKHLTFYFFCLYAAAATGRRPLILYDCFTPGPPSLTTIFHPLPSDRTLRKYSTHPNRSTVLPPAVIVVYPPDGVRRFRVWFYHIILRNHSIHHEKGHLFNHLMSQDTGPSSSRVKIESDVQQHFYSIISFSFYLLWQFDFWCYKIDDDRYMLIIWCDTVLLRSPSPPILTLMKFNL